MGLSNNALIPIYSAPPLLRPQNTSAAVYPPWSYQPLHSATVDFLRQRFVASLAIKLYPLGFEQRHALCGRNTIYLRAINEEMDDDEPRAPFTENPVDGTRFAEEPSADQN